MTITNSFRKAVADGDVKDIRIMLKESLIVDPSFADFNEKSSYASNISGIYVAHDGRELNDDEATWDDHYIDKLMAQLSTNFSKERMEHLKKVIHKLRPVSIQAQTRKSNNVELQKRRVGYQRQRHYARQRGSNRGFKIAGGAVVGAVAGAGIAAVTSSAVLGGVIIGAVVGSGVATIMTKGNA